MMTTRTVDQRDTMRWTWCILEYVCWEASRPTQVVTSAKSNKMRVSHSIAQILGQMARSVEHPQTLELRGREQGGEGECDSAYTVSSGN